MFQSKYTHHYTLTAGECDPEGCMSLAELAERLIEVATEHANNLGIGYDALITKNIGWVLSRLAIEMERYPGINEEYTITSWIEGYNRFFSERNFAVTDADGNTLGYARTVWVAMDYKSRTMADLSSFETSRFPIADLPCPIAKTPRLASPGNDAQTDEYTFRYRDLDVNRHVNTVRYIDLILNHWPLEFFDRMMPVRLDVLFHNECHFGERVALRVADGSAGENICEIIRPDGKKAVACRICWKKTQKNVNLH